MIYIHNACLFTPTGVIEHEAIFISGETVTAIGREGDLPGLATTERIDANAQSLFPGFIDLQING